MKEVIMVGKVLIGLGLGVMLVVGGGGAAQAGKAHHDLECESTGASVPGGGQSSGSPGSPFHDGMGGQRYSDNSQYDVACFGGAANRP
jgi:hypothetical protein